jgi:hypothetical protein
MASILKIHISDWREKIPDGSNIRRGNEKAMVKKRINTQAELIAGVLMDL